MTPPSRAIRAAHRACQLALPVYLVALAAGRPLSRGSLARESMGDYGYAHLLSQQVEATRSYDWFFAYTPPNVALRLSLAELGFELSAALWLAALAGSAWLSIEIGLRLLGIGRDPRRTLVAAVAVVSASYFLEWDLRIANANSVLLALTLGFLWCLWRAEERPGLAWAAGFLLAASIALKLYSGVFLAYLVLVWRPRTLAAAGVGLVLFFGAVPALRFGPEAALEITRSWLSVMAGLADPDFVERLVAYKVAPQAAFAVWPGEGRVDPRWLARGVQAAWLLLLLAWFAPRLARFARGAAPALAREQLVTDASVLVLALLPLSPLLQPHHLVLALLPVLWVARGIFDSALPPRVRGIHAAACAGLFVATHATPTGPAKGLPILAILFGLLVLLFRARR